MQKVIILGIALHILGIDSAVISPVQVNCPNVVIIKLQAVRTVRNTII